jgi:hypothetical protein
VVLRFAGFELDQQRAELRRPDGCQIKLRPKTLEMLQLFAANTGRVLSKQELMEAVWPNIHVAEDSLFQCIREVRSALGDDRRQMIRVVSGGRRGRDGGGITRDDRERRTRCRCGDSRRAGKAAVAVGFARKSDGGRARGIVRGRRVCGSGSDLQTGPHLRAITADRSRDADRRRER